MANEPGTRIDIEWFNITYRSVILACTLLVVGLVGAGGYWYYFKIFAPRAAAAETIYAAESRLKQAGALTQEPRLVEIVENAGEALGEAQRSFELARFDDARVAAIRSENLSLNAIALAGGQQVQDRQVRFYRLEGDVRFKREGEFSWETARVDTTLQIGDQVKTSSSASAELIYFDGTRTKIQPGSLLEIRELYENPVTKVRRVREKLNFGEVESSTQRRNVEGSYHEVATDKAAARAEDAGEFRVAYDKQDKTSEIDVFSGGTVVVASSDRSESLDAGESIKADARGRLSDKKRLPGMPLLIAPRDQRVFIYEDPLEEKFTLTWEGVPGVNRYRLSIAGSALFSKLLYDAERGGTRAVLDGLPEGSYYWRVSAVSSTGIRGKPTSPRRFRVSSQKIRDTGDTVPPVLKITEFVPIGMMVIVNGVTEPGATLWIDNEKFEVSDDGTFYAVVRLRQEGLNDLRFVAQDTAGNEAVLNRSTVVDTF